MTLTARPPLQRLLRRRRRLRGAAAIAMALVALSILLDRAGVLGPRADDHVRFDQAQLTVARVVDGDTLVIDAQSGPVNVRLLGIDAPEPRNDDGSPAHWASEATEALRARVTGRTVTIRLEPTQTRDRYQRLLAYVYLGDSDMVNLWLVREGHAYAERRFGHTFAPQFEQVETEARTRRRGLWADVRESQMPAWRQRWLSDLRQQRASPP